MIKYLYANNYKSFVNFRINFDQLNLLIGQNGSGKSNVFYLIACLRDLIQGQNMALFTGFPASTKTRWLKSDIQTFELGLSEEEHKYVYKLEIEQNAENNTTKIISEKVECNGILLYQMTGSGAVLYDDHQKGMTVLVDPTASGVSFVPSDSSYQLLQGFRRQIDRIILCIPNPRTMQETITNDVYIPRVDFSNIASTYAELMQLDPEIYNDLTNRFREIFPAFFKTRISVEQFGKYLSFDYKYNDVTSSYHLNELSDGERMLFALYLLLYGFTKRGYYILLDEPDNYVSIRELQPWCIDLEEEADQNGQCLLISHHPEIIDYFADTRGIWLSRLKSGESVVIDAPGISDNKDLLTYSEMIARGMLDEIR